MRYYVLLYTFGQQKPERIRQNFSDILNGYVVVHGRRIKFDWNDAMLRRNRWIKRIEILVFTGEDAEGAVCITSPRV